MLIMKYFYLIVLLFTATCIAACGNKSQCPQANCPNDLDRIREAYKQGNWDIIISIGDTLIGEDDPMNISIIYAEALAVNGNQKKAIDVLNNKIANTPDDYYLFQTKGNIYYLIEELDSAIACYDKVIDMRPTYARPYVYEGEIYTIKGEKQKAIARYLEAIRLFEENDFIVETECFCNRILDIDSSNVKAKNYLEQIQGRRKISHSSGSQTTRE